MTLRINPSKTTSFSASLKAPTFNCSNITLSDDFNIIAANINGAIIPANLLQIPMMLIRLAALSIGPTIVIYGLAAACKIVNPVPMENKPIRKNQ